MRWKRNLSTGKLTASTRFPGDNDTIPVCHLRGVSRLVLLWGLLRRFSLIKHCGLNKAAELLFNEPPFCDSQFTHEALAGGSHSRSFLGSERG
jgi:hypothetical protein